MRIGKTTFRSRVHLTVLLLLQGFHLQADDGLRFKSLAQRVAENEKRNRLLEMSYVYEVTRQKISLGKNSEALQSESHTFEVTPLEEGDYRRLIKKDGQPLSEKEARKEQQKLDKHSKHSGLRRNAKSGEKENERRLAKNRLERCGPDSLERSTEGRKR
jgi:hypothetical protein